MKLLLHITIRALCIAFLVLQACNVVGDSVPADSPDYVLDSLRIIPEVAATAPQRQSDNNPTANSASHNEAKEPVRKHRKPRHGDEEGMEFLRVGEEPPARAQRTVLSRNKKHQGKKRTASVAAAKKGKKRTSLAAGKRSLKHTTAETHVSATAAMQALPTSGAAKPKFRYSLRATDESASTAESKQADKSASPTIPSVAQSRPSRPTSGTASVASSANSAAAAKQEVSSKYAAQMQAYRGDESNESKEPNKQELEEQQRIEKELRSASKLSASQLFGRSVTIAITGVDSRLGVSQRHADANHILRIWLDKGEIEVFSVPRGTPVEAGFSSKSLNYLANLRSNKGREAYLRKMGEITGVGKIDYWVELGFSQAMGVMEMLGFKENAKSTLRVLRSRKAFATGDYQRCYNQGQFIRQMILRHFGKSSGFMGGVALRGALGLVETNLKYDVAKALIDELQSKGFPRNEKAVSVNLRPPYKPQIKEIDLSDESAIAELNNKLEKKLKKGGYIGTKKAPAFNPNKYEDKLENIVDKAVRIVKTKPKAAVAVLKRVYEQRAWIQIPDKKLRDEYFKKICLTLIEGNELLGFMIEADNVRYFYEQQLQALQHESASK